MIGALSTEFQENFISSTCAQVCVHYFLMQNQYKHKTYHAREALGHLANQIGARKAAKYFDVIPSLAQYWQRKVSDPTFHPNSWGGNKTFKFSPEQRQELWMLLNSNDVRYSWYPCVTSH